VAPRIKDLEELEKELQRIAPELSYVIAHGQMKPSEIDNIMSDFYEGKYDILLCTTIIESGIDIQAANTMIIHRAEMLGLAQLYQLRGRIGRSKIRGFAYLVVNNSMKMTNSASKRLEILENIDTLGAGFTIASYDSDIRGFGNLLGDEQSGHIKEVGAELYQDMLEKAIEELDSKDFSEKFTTNININLPVYIPNEYIEDSDVRLGIYKRISMLGADDEIENFRDELIDRFGTIPQPILNLLSLIKIKCKSRELKIKDLDSGPNGILLEFIPDEKIAERIIKFAQNNKHIIKLRPDNKLFAKVPSNQANILDTIYSMLDGI
jgi:transcription-repair coupling factor (superfamily II helicase)